MALKILKAIWFLSLLAVVAVFLYVYASLPENVTLLESGDALSVSRETFFYVSLALLAVMNTIVFTYNRFAGKTNPDLAAWVSGLIFCMNFFMIIVLSYVNLYNSLEKFDYTRLGTIIYGSIGLIVVWVLGWPTYQISKKYLFKEQV